MGTFVVGLAFAIVIVFAAKKAFSDMKKGKCSGCSCSTKKAGPVQIKF